MKAYFPYKMKEYLTVLLGLLAAIGLSATFWWLMSQTT